MPLPRSTIPETTASDTVRLEPCEVTQEDREAAAKLLGGAAPEGLKEGRQDSLSLVQALARHRLNTRPLSFPQGEEVERIVDAITPEMLRREDGRDTFAWVSAVAEKAIAALSTQEQFAENANSPVEIGSHFGNGGEFDPTCAKNAPVGPAQDDVERVANAIEIALLTIEGDVRIDSLTDEELNVIARAALSSMSPTPKDEGQISRNSKSVEGGGEVSSSVQSLSPSIVEKVKELRDAAQEVFDHLNERIDIAIKNEGPIPVFAGLARLSDALNDTEALSLLSAGVEKESGE